MTIKDKLKLMDQIKIRNEEAIQLHKAIRGQ